ncbi:MAG: BMP family ABC transporter substrate-binding protein [Capsulimonadales bacterium]|nr:BMP family ABC transporter substrate-binding protein [Capsulimonadales bacterium]
MPLTRRCVFFVGMALLPLSLVSGGCPSPDTTGPSSPLASPAATPDPNALPSGGKKIKAGLVTDVGGIDDKSFNASAWEGLKKAESQLQAEIKFTESKSNADYLNNLTRFADNGYDVVFAVGFLMQDAMKSAAARYPNVKFAIVDGNAPDLPNAISAKFREEEGCFLVGALAGLVTKKNVVGFVGGMEMPLIEKFEAAYVAGVKTTNPKASVKVGYAGRFDDPQKGRELALSQMEAGADIIFHASGKTGLGVIKAVQSSPEGNFAIGVDRDQDGEAPGRVLTSMVKRVDVAVYDVCQETAEGSFQAGTIELGLKEGGVGLSPMTHTRDRVPKTAMDRVDALKQAIIDGKIKPPKSRKELATFKPPV